MAPGLEPIPSPPGLPLLGNISDINPDFPLGSLLHLADKYGPIYRLNLAGKSVVFVTTQALVNEVCDEHRFAKGINNVLNEVRNGVHDGLFTAKGESEPNWGIAHRVLMPAFGPAKIQAMFGEMHDIASQLAMKWARHGSSMPIQASEDFTRLALDTLALCAMDYRFNSYYRDEMHPFIESMGNFLKESGSRSRRPGLVASLFYRNADAKYWEDIELMRQTAKDVLDARKDSTTTTAERKDLLSAMLSGVDPKTGRQISDDSIIDNLITFLIAGHETTSGLLSFAFYQLIKNPEAYRKAQEEVDRVVGTGPITVQHISKLPYIAAVLRETLRLTATIPALNLVALQDEILGAKYAIKKGEFVVALLARSQLDPAVFGSTAKEFIPDRMLDDNFDRLNREFPNCWKPFGNGMRACIGRPFAWQEAILVTTMLLQNFNFRMDDPAYTLQIKQTLTIKPKDFFMRATLREGLTAGKLEHRLAGAAVGSDASDKQAQATATNGHPNGQKAQPGSGKPLSIFYGSNTGTCEALAQRLAADAPSHGFAPTIVDPLDAANQKMPKDQPTIIITASYEGQPPDNAALFIGWLESLKGREMEGVEYTVFGCGHHDWSATFHRIPKLVDTTLETLGGTRVAPIGLADAAQGNMFTDFETWEDETFWPAMEAKYGTAKTAGQHSDQVAAADITVDVTTPRASTLRQDVHEAVVVAAYALTPDDDTDGPAAKSAGAAKGAVKRHMEIQLPSDARYEAGDYLAVLPLNPRSVVERAMRRFGLPWDAQLTISSGNAKSSSSAAATASGWTPLPTDVPMAASDILGAYVELSQPATRRGVASLASFGRDEATRAEISAMATAEAYGGPAGVAARRLSVLDLLEQYGPSKVDVPLAAFLALLPPMRVRQYSISSSPLGNPRHCTLTYSVLDAPALGDVDHKNGLDTNEIVDGLDSRVKNGNRHVGKHHQRRHVGVASSYLASLSPGDRLHVAVRPSNAAFHPPTDPDNVPVIMVAAGSGIAPFRGFVQERAAQLAVSEDRKLAPAMLFFGCRHPGQDDLYREELDRWQAMGAVDVRRAYSRLAASSGANAAKTAATSDHEGCRHVQDRLWHDRHEVADLWARGAKVYVCGSRVVGDAVKDTAMRISRERALEKKGKELSDEELEAWFNGVRNERFATDVFD